MALLHAPRDLPRSGIDTLTRGAVFPVGFEQASCSGGGITGWASGLASLETLPTLLFEGTTYGAEDTLDACQVREMRSGLVLA